MRHSVRRSSQLARSPALPHTPYSNDLLLPSRESECRTWEHLGVPSPSAVTSVVTRMPGACPSERHETLYPLTARSGASRSKWKRQYDIEFVYGRSPALSTPRCPPSPSVASCLWLSVRLFYADASQLEPSSCAHRRSAHGNGCSASVNGRQEACGAREVGVESAWRT